MSKSAGDQIRLNREQYSGEELLRRNYLADRLFQRSPRQSNESEEEYQHRIKELAEELYSNNNTVFIENLLRFDYGYIPDMHKNKTASIEEVFLDKVVPSNKNHYENLKPDKASFHSYKNPPESLPVAVLRRAGSEYIIIDGHHRIKICQENNQEKAIVFLLD